MSRKIIYQKFRLPKRTETDLLGTDLKFPMQTNSAGDLATISGIDNVVQAMIDIMEDLQGEVVYHEDMGGELLKGVHRACTQANADRIARKCKEQIMQHEARIATLEIKGEPIHATESAEEDVIRLTSHFTVMTYHHEHNFVYDFKIGEVSQWQ